MPNQQPGNQDLARFQYNLRKTALGVKFAKILFTDPKRFTTKQLIEVAKALGLNIPKEALLTADILQMYATGSAAIEAYQTAQTAKDYQEVVKPSMVALRLSTSIAEQNGWIDQDSASMIRFGSDVAMIVGSGGSDVSAWISAGLELGIQSESAKAEAAQLAAKAAKRVYDDKISQEKTSLATSIKKLDSGEIGIFGFLVEFANKGNLLFENAVVKNPAFDKLREKLPGLNFIPTGDWTFKGSGSRTTWYGDTKTEDASFSVKGLYSVPPEQAFDMFFKWVIEPYARGYLEADRLYSAQGKASIFDTAILGLFQQSARLDSGQKALDQLLFAQLTPFELGVHGTFDNYVQAPQSKLEAIVSNFGMKKVRETLTKEQMIALDQAGSINQLSQIRESQELITNKFNYEETGLDLAINKYFVDFRNMANFVSVLDSLDLIYSDPMYAKWKTSSMFLPEYEVFPKIKDFKNRFEFLWKASMIRKVNRLALGNVMNFMGSNKIQLLNPNEQGPAIYGYK